MKKATGTKRTTIVEIISGLLLIFFVHSAISNLINTQSLKNLLAFYTQYGAVIAWTIICLEILVVVLLFMPRTRLAGFIITILLSVLAGYFVIKLPHYPHHFGGILNNFSDTQHIMFYTLLSVMSIVGLLLLLLKPKRREKASSEPVVFT
jgi:hypothetical protein